MQQRGARTASGSDAVSASLLAPYTRSLHGSTCVYVEKEVSAQQLSRTTAQRSVQRCTHRGVIARLAERARRRRSARISGIRSAGGQAAMDSSAHQYRDARHALRVCSHVASPCADGRAMATPQRAEVARPPKSSEALARSFWSESGRLERSAARASAPRDGAQPQRPRRRASGIFRGSRARREQQSQTKRCRSAHVRRRRGRAHLAASPPPPTTRLAAALAACRADTRGGMAPQRGQRSS